MLLPTLQVLPSTGNRNTTWLRNEKEVIVFQLPHAPHQTKLADTSHMCHTGIIRRKIALLLTPYRGICKHMIHTHMPIHTHRARHTAVMPSGARIFYIHKRKYIHYTHTCWVYIHRSSRQCMHAALCADNYLNSKLASIVDVQCELYSYC